MNSKAYKANVLKLTMLAVMMIVVTLAFLFVGVKFHNEKLLRYAMKIRIHKVLAMIITEFAIGGATIVFQSVINNKILKHCLLGINSFYTLIHKSVVFVLVSGCFIFNI